ncbi:SDR family oxidoreductase [Bacillus sp. 1P06AnD]|uniref:SDR family oxidoreductase n=1 Tax=Bacillus sp. 1P06AnD TaxID=3132208 RepID=UPI00399F4A36
MINHPLFDLSGKTAIVTGGARGLGLQMAIALAEAGANIMICSRNAEKNNEALDELRHKGIDAYSMKCDITNPEECDNVVSKTLEQWGCIDILINNSGASWGAPAADMPLEAWNKVMNVNATGTFLMSQAAGKVMIKQQSGKIINISSVAGLIGTNPDVMDTIGYSASKGAILSLTRDLAVKWGREGINVNAIAPGFFPTKMSNVLIERSHDALLAGTPLNRFGNDEDLKGAVIFLASKASDYVTGTCLTVDGGISIM